MVKTLFSFPMIFYFSFFHLENKQLDRQEYNLWTIRTTGQEITDEDWSSIRGNC
jgi:hypothetical protein